MPKALLVCAAVALAAACATGGVTDQVVDWRLRELAAARPDTIVGVLVRTSVPPDSAQRASLEEAGLDVGTVVGTIVTGRLVARAAAAVGRLPFVLRVELARRIPIS